MCLSASVPLVRLTTISSLRCWSRRPAGGWTDLSETSSRSWHDQSWRTTSQGRPARASWGWSPRTGHRLAPAAWLRLLPEHDRGYGFVDAATPELSIGVVPTHRGRGIGSLLLNALVVPARAQRHEALSLSVEPDNPARRLYERCGFQVVGAVDGTITMLLVL